MALTPTFIQTPVFTRQARNVNAYFETHGGDTEPRVLYLPKFNGNIRNFHKWLCKKYFCLIAG